MMICRYPFLVRYPLFIPLLMLFLLVMNGYYIALVMRGRLVTEDIVMLGLDLLLTVLALASLVLVYRRRALLTMPVELSEGHIHAVVIHKKNACQLRAEYCAVPWGDIQAVQDFGKMSPHGREMGEHEGIELLTPAGSLLVWSHIQGFATLKNTVLAKACRKI